jgi:hypothetical protein
VIVKDLGPYAAIELILPGGSVIAVLLWLYRRSKPVAAACGPVVPARQIAESPMYRFQ